MFRQVISDQRELKVLDLTGAHASDVDMVENWAMSWSELERSVVPDKNVRTCFNSPDTPVVYEHGSREASYLGG